MRDERDGPVPNLHGRVQAAARRGAPGRRDEPEPAGTPARHLARAAPHLGEEVRGRGPGGRPADHAGPAGLRGQDRRPGAQGRPADDGAGPAQKGAPLGTPGERREFLRRERPEACPVRAGCRVMSLAPSTYYYRAKAKSAEAMAAEARLVARIHAICAEFPRYGYRRVTAQLKAEGERVDHKRVSRTTREQDLRVRPKRRFVVTTDSDHDGPIFPDLAKDLAPAGPDQPWVADLTYIRIPSGFVYLAVILDAWSRRVVGWALGRRVDADLALAALEGAIASRRPPSGCVHHSDRGSQYAAEPYRTKLAAPGLKGSMGRRGNPYDNAKAESFTKTLKHEEVHLSGYETFADVVARLPRFLEQVYNARRLHSALGYVSPARFEEINTREAA